MCSEVVCVEFTDKTQAAELLAVWVIENHCWRADYAQFTHQCFIDSIIGRHIGL